MPIMSGLHTGYEGSSTTEIHRTSVFMDVHAVHPGAAINHSGLRTVKTTLVKLIPSLMSLLLLMHQEMEESLMVANQFFHKFLLAF